MEASKRATRESSNLGGGQFHSKREPRETQWWLGAACRQASPTATGATKEAPTNNLGGLHLDQSQHVVAGNVSLDVLHGRNRKRNLTTSVAVLPLWLALLVAVMLLPNSKVGCEILKVVLGNL